MGTFDRVTQYLLEPSRRDGVAGYLHATQAKAIHALLEQQQRAGVSGALAEIGVFKGKTLIALALAANDGEAVVGIDPMRIGATDLMPDYLRNVQRCLPAEVQARVNLQRRLSTDLGALDWMRLLQKPARFVHLDGHHARETILHDVQLAASWLTKGGLVVIDDFLNELHPDLTSGIFDALAAHPQIEPIAVIPRMGHIEEGGSKLVCTTRGDGAAYLDALDRALADELRPWNDRMLGREVRVYRSRAPIPAKPPGVPVVFALHDERGDYWPYTAVALSSLAQYATIPISVHVLHDETLSDTARRRLEQIAAEMDVPLHFVRVMLPPGVDRTRLRHFSPASLYRLLIPNLFGDAPLVIYLDSDIVVNGLDIAHLINAVPAGATLSAVVDPYIAIAPKHAAGLAQLGLDAATYFNSGVLALRPALLPRDLLPKFMAWSDAHPDATHPDQDFLNVQFQGAAHLLPGAFNVQVGVYQQALLKSFDKYSGKFLHYVGQLKPLAGILSSGMLPFWIHAQRVTELHQGAFRLTTRYLLPENSDPDAASLLELGSNDTQRVGD